MINSFECSVDYLQALPIFTIGASTTAVYYVTLRLVRDEDGQTIRLLFPVLQGEFQAGYGAVASDSSDRNCAGI